MTEEMKAILERARKTLMVAKITYREGFYNSSINRSYYCYFYCVQVFLAAENLAAENVFVKTHKGANVKFSELYIKTKKVPASWSGVLKSIEQLREEADYDFSEESTSEEAKIALRDASDFYRFTELYFGA